MKSRYDYMSEGVVADEVSDSLYPDPLTLNYLNFKMTSVPKRNVMSNSKIPFLWVEMENNYGSPELDDIILTLNGCQHKNFLKPGDILYFPEQADIEDSFTKDRYV